MTRPLSDDLRRCRIRPCVSGICSKGGGVPGSTAGSGKLGIAARVARTIAGLFPGSGIGAPSTGRIGSMRPAHGKPRWKPAQAACPRALSGAIPIPATQERLRRPPPTDRPAEPTAGNISSPPPPADAPGKLTAARGGCLPEAKRH